ncbi:hypothetical protein GCM10020219_028210 [Nonomuraea dietziae]
MEEGVTAAYLELSAAQGAATRKLAALAMQESVIRSYGFRPSVTWAFPGMPAKTVPAKTTAPPSATPGG